MFDDSFGQVIAKPDSRINIANPWRLFRWSIK
jgi:hypothetical protein